MARRIKRTARRHRALSIVGSLALVLGATLGMVTAVGADEPTTGEPGAVEESTTTAPPTTEPTTEPTTTAPTTAPPQGSDSSAGITALSQPSDDITIQANQGAIWTTDVSCGGVNINLFDTKPDVYLNGGPQGGGPGLDDGFYFVQVTTPDGDVLGKTNAATAEVSSGNFVECYHLVDILFTTSSGFTVAGFDDTTNNGGEYKVWVSKDSTFPGGTTKTDNFKVDFETETTTEVHDPSHTDITNGSVAAGTLVHDQATVAGGASTPGGDVVFEFFSNDSCDGNADSSETVALDNAGIAESTAAAHTAGSYSYLVSYEGDGTHNPSEAHCEPFTVTGTTSKLTSSATTEVHDPSHNDITNTVVPVGTAVHDEVTVTGSGATPTGSVDFDFFSNGICNGTPDGTETVALSSGVAESAGKTTLSAGSYSYRAHYTGDDNYFADDALCEPFSIVEVGGDITVRIDVDKQVVGNVNPANGTKFVVNVTCTGDAAVNKDLTFTYPNGLGVQSVTAQIPSNGSITCTVTETDPGGVILEGYKINGGSTQSSAPTIVLNLGNPDDAVTVVNDPSNAVEVGGISTALPFTGSSTSILLKIAAWMLTVGGIALFAVRRRNKRLRLDA